ncbi:MAG: SDR family oxidoreductase [Solirubrobacteraceae bacterium]
MIDEPSATISERLAGKALILTGASGFLGKAVLALCLGDVPELERIVVLLRAPDDEAARRRLEEEILPGAAFAGLDDEVVDTRLTALAGDVAADALGRDGGDGRLVADVSADALGREDADALAGIDIVIHCAASVSFEQPLDEILDINVLGPVRLLRALREAGSDPHVVHVSSAYAAGKRTGLVLERPSGSAPADPDLDLDAELAAARAWRRDLDAESRLPDHQRRVVAEAKREVGPAGGPAVGVRAEAMRRKWVDDQLVERGRERSRALGWADGYALSKALGERHLQRERPRALTIVRPSIIESALRRPHPGWLEDLKVADPIILAYGAGLIPRFPANPAARLDIVPVDLVANVCLAAAAHEPEHSPRTLQVVTGSSNPVTVERVVQAITEYFREHPLTGEDGLPVDVPEWRLTSYARVLGALDRAGRVLRAGRDLVDGVPLPRADRLELRLHREQRRLDLLRRLAEIYGPYVELDCMFDDRGTRELAASLHPSDRERFDFDVAMIDWPTYLREVHLPALRALAPAPRVDRPAARRDRPALVAGESGPPALAFFDVEGVVIEANVAHFYAWLRTRDMPELDRLLWRAGLATRVPGWMRTDRRSRADFNRRFYRLYHDLPAAVLREQATGALSDFILPRIQHEAVRRIRAHRRRGDRVVLITGALDFLVAPLRHLGDELVAARLVERFGRFTSELAEPPLTADGRASLAARMAAEHGLDLADCHAYADSVADLPLLELVGHPHPVNPDFRLEREARRRGWPLEEWATEPGARNRPPAPVEV